MASNFQQHMGGPGQMMPQRMPQQRPQQGSHASMQIQSVIFTALSSQTGPLSGWQSSVIINERITLIFNIIGNLRLASQHQPNAPPLQKMVEIGIKFEKEIFEKCTSKEQYKHEVEVKLQQLLERRNQQQANLQHTIQQQAQVQAQQAQAQAQQMMMNHNIQGQGMAMPQQPGQQSFAHLQHQMQASPLPGQQSQQNVMGMQNQGLPQNSAQNQQQQQFMAMQQQQQQNQSQQPQNVPGRPGGNQPSLSQQESSLVSDLTNRLMAQTSEEDKNNLRARLRTQMDPASYQKCQAQGMDPIILCFRQQAIGRLRAERSARLQLQQGQNMPTATPMQQQRSMQPSPAQAAAAMGGNVDFSSFMGNMETLAAQQQQAGVMAEQSGQTVVPASSGAPRNPTPQPGVMPGQGMNDQRGVANPNPRAQQQQQMFNAQQQLNHQRLQHAQAQQQQQSQAAARLNAQKNAQQIALNGQPGGMGPGPVPQQSPAMATLNAPMRTPSQQNSHPELPQANSNGPFGQPIDPRFMQGNQRQPGQANGMNAAMFAMGQSLPPEKLNEVVNKWNNNNGPGGRPGMPMQGNPQARPGMPVQQPGQMNTQNQAAQFAMANPGQRPPPNMMGAMNPQQQLILQQQMAALRPGQMQQRNLPANVMQMEQRNMLQMDTADIPPIFLTQQGMPQGFPPDIKKWGQMKQWVAQNPNLGPNALEGVKNFQRLHFQQLMQRSRQQQQGQPGGMPPNQAGMPGVMQSGGPGMAAPVAPMGPNPMMTQGMPVPQLRQPTPQEIQTIRSHPSGKLAHATDDQIRTIFMTNQAKAQAQAQAQAQGVQMNPQQQQEQQRRLLALQQMKQVQMQQQQQQQNNGQQPQPGQAPQPNMTGLQNQAKPISTPQSKPGPAPKPASSNTPNQAARPQPNARNAAQNTSPAQPVKNLKRQNSDDVVEVPNPNTQQQQPTPQQVSNIPQVRKLNPQQVAALTPEMKKKYEAMLRMNQMNQVNGQNTASPMDQMKLKEISKQEEQDSQHNLQDIPMDTETKQKMRKMLESIVNPLANVTRVVFKWFSLTLDEDQARKFYRARYRLAKQFQDPQMTLPKENFSILPQEVEAARALLGNMVKDLSAKYPDLKKPNANRAQGSQGLPQPSQNAQPQTPLNAANLQQQQQQLNKQLAHQRSNSRSSHTPVAPTSTQPPFQLGATSPHGAPVYAKNTLDVDKLHIPARKKQKQAPATSQGTPGSNSSPQVAKAVSPEMKRQQQPEMKAQKPALCCKEPDCERHQIGFDSEEDLKKHTQEEHIGPLENPDKFVQDILATSLGLDAQGQPKKPAPAVPEQAPKMATSNSKQGQTPNIKAGNTPSAATPMMRQASMNRQASATGAKPNAPSKGTPAKEAATKAPEQKDVKKESQTPAPLDSNDAWADAMIDPTELFTVFQQFETGAGGSISDMNVFRGITPNDTPESSKDGVSEPNSDISDGVALDINMDLFDSNWQPFGPSDTEGLGDFTIANDEDLMMFDEERPLGYPNFDDVDTSMFDKPFSLDTKLFSFNSS